MKKLRIGVYILIVITLLSSTSSFAKYNDAIEKENTMQLTKNEIGEIDTWVEKNMKVGKIPGVMVVIVKDDQIIYNKGFGYADLKSKRPVSQKTLFELGSTSKAFTGLAILHLKSEGLIFLDDPVKKYIPWFEMKFKGEEKGVQIDQPVDITLEQLLHQTSGIPFKSIGDIPIDNSTDALERAVKTQVGDYLDFYPGKKYQYATINYDILGLVIENVTGMSYESYMSENIIKKLKLENTFMSRDEARKYDMSKGYKLGFLNPHEYDAPMYRGNLPAGYFIMNGLDLAKWLKIQIGTEDLDGFNKNLIALSHIQNQTVPPDDDGSFYCVGWKLYQNGGNEYSHGGSNPNYSSQFIFIPQEKLAVGVLANLDSSYTTVMAEGIRDILQKDKMRVPMEDMYKNIDNVSTVIFFMSLVSGIIILIFILFILKDFFKKERTLSNFQTKNIYGFVVSLIFLVFLGYCLYCTPSVLFDNVPWKFVFVWAPLSFIPAMILLYLVALLFNLYFQLIIFFPKKNEKTLFSLIILGFVSGFGNALIIFSINEAINRIRKIQLGLILFFLLGLLLYIIGQKIIKSKMIKITNKVVLEKRILLIDSILDSSLDKIDSIGEGKIHASLNNDTEVISNAPSVIIGIFTDTVTLICCFIYLGIINIVGLIISILVIFISAALYHFVGKTANNLLEGARDTQNLFFRFINDLIFGFKELSMNNIKSNQFKDDMVDSCSEYKEKRIAASIKFVNVGIIGDLLFTIVIATVAFIFPYIFMDINGKSLSTYIFVFLYINTPVNGILISIPELFSIRVSWNRINEFISHMTNFSEEDKRKKPIEINGEEINLKIEDVVYDYKSEDKVFRLGEVTLEVNSGEIIFITGGNGSGKSTLAKILAGLYKPHKGRILINNREVERNEISEYYSHVFSDFHLFKKLYGINYERKEEEIKDLLKMLQIEDKVEINNGEFSTLKLSTGQRKRLALLVSYLEDKKIFIFDEWASDQDFEFRRYFYEKFIKDLRNRGKCVIVISHDDRYFHVADKLIKMDMGKIVSV